MAQTKKPKSNPNENKSDKFKRLAEKRTQKAIKSISMLRALSGNSYESKPEQHAKIISSLTTEVAAVENAFKGHKPAAQQFKL